MLWAGLTVCALVVLLLLNQGPEKGKELSYSEFLNQVANEKVAEVTYDNVNAKITGKFESGSEFHTTGLQPFPDADLALLREHDVVLKPKTPQAGFLEQWLPVLFFPLLVVGFFVFMQRRAQGQMGNIMSIGRSRAKTYSTERPGTTFADVAGYEGVKRRSARWSTSSRTPRSFSQIGARIPKGVLLVGPPGTGKTLIARAVAGEAGVPFLSVSGSDFMEMFVGVGASRVRDLFESARKMGRAIIFIDEIDSIGRKRGAGLGGGHDEREQTLNQMLNEMDGFEATEGIVMMAATNRPDILDPALLRPGRFDRQVVVPLPSTMNESSPSCGSTPRASASDPDVDLVVVARGTPGMSGAELANLVNEAALHAVRTGLRDDPPTSTSSTPATGSSWVSDASRWCSPRRRRS
jgi:cell division protease FtsH